MRANVALGSTPRGGRRGPRPAARFGSGPDPKVTRGLVRARASGRASPRASPALRGGLSPRNPRTAKYAGLRPTLWFLGDEQSPFLLLEFCSFPRVSSEIASHAKLSRDGHPFRTTAPPLSIVRGAMVATLACAPVTFTASAPRARGRVPASRSRAARSGAPARSIEATARAFPSPGRVRGARDAMPRLHRARTRTRWCTTPTTSSSARPRRGSVRGARRNRRRADLGARKAARAGWRDAFLVAARRHARARRGSPTPRRGGRPDRDVRGHRGGREREDGGVRANRRRRRDARNGFAATTAVVALFSSFADGGAGDDGETFEPDHPTWLALNAAEAGDEPTRVENAGSDEPSPGGGARRSHEDALHREELGRGEFGFCEADVLRFFGGTARTPSAGARRWRG